MGRTHRIPAWRSTSAGRWKGKQGWMINDRSHCLEALAVNNGWAALIVFLLGDPHLLEGGKGSKDGSSGPDGVFPLWGSNDLDLDGGWSKSGDFLLHTVSNTRVHGGASGHDSVGIEIL